MEKEKLTKDQIELVCNVVKQFSESIREVGNAINEIFSDPEFKKMVEELTRLHDSNVCPSCKSDDIQTASHCNDCGDGQDYG